MNNLTINVRKYKALLKDWSELHLTQDQYNTVFLAKQDKKQNDFITIKCPDTWKIEYCWELWQIKQLIEKETSNNQYIAICDLWERHEVINWKIQCDCLNKMWINKWDIIPWLSLLWYKINSTADITKEMRQKLYIECRKNDFKERVDNEFNKIKNEWIKYKKSIDPEYALNFN